MYTICDMNVHVNAECVLWVIAPYALNYLI